MGKLERNFAILDAKTRKVVVIGCVPLVNSVKNLREINRPIELCIGSFDLSLGCSLGSLCHNFIHPGDLPQGSNTAVTEARKFKPFSLLLLRTFSAYSFALTTLKDLWHVHLFSFEVALCIAFRPLHTCELMKRTRLSGTNFVWTPTITKFIVRFCGWRRLGWEIGMEI